MAPKLTRARLSGVWSATPTPLTEKLQLDKVSVKRLVAHHLRLGVQGLFMCGTCGEGPWLPDAVRWAMVAETAQHNRGRLLLSVQITDNSEYRMLDNAAAAKKAGADIAVIAPPFLPPNGHPRRLLDVYLRTIRQSPLPVGIYDRGKAASAFVTAADLKRIYAEPNVVMVKDSSADMDRMRLAVAARRRRPALSLMTGWEFNCVPYLQAGYDGLLLGGGIFNGYMAGQIKAAFDAGDIERAEALQARMNKMMYEVFGGKKLTCWLSGQKRLLVELGVFRTWKSILEFPLNKRTEAAIKRVAQREADMLLP